MPGCKPIIMVHGGAGAWNKAPLERRRKAMECITHAVITGYETLLKEGAVAGVVSAVMVMEECGAFNAGIGSVPNARGYREMDAGIMDGAKGDAGAVALLRGYRNPILIALKVMEESGHVMLGGEGASEFARKKGFVIDEELLKPLDTKELREFSRDRWIGDTVGAVAVDSRCRTAAGSSTGGVRGKHPGRIGDSPVPGAGFYANHFAAATATGVGEVMLLIGASKWLVDDATKLGSVCLAGHDIIKFVNTRYKKGTLGLIAVDVKGGYARFYNTEHLPVAIMYKGLRKPRVIGFP